MRPHSFVSVLYLLCTRNIYELFGCFHSRHQSLSIMRESQHGNLQTQVLKFLTTVRFIAPLFAEWGLSILFDSKWSLYFINFMFNETFWTLKCCTVFQSTYFDKNIVIYRKLDSLRYKKELNVLYFVTNVLILLI